MHEHDSKQSNLTKHFLIFVLCFCYNRTLRKMLFKTICAMSSIIIVPLLLDYFMKRIYKKKLKKIKSVQVRSDNNCYYHCMFWTMKNSNCREHMYNNIECGDLCSVTYLQTLAKIVASAKISISMCMYHLTLRQITDELIYARNRGVIVRIITDRVTSQVEHSKFRLLKEKFDFDIRSPPYKHSLMHHKYCVIDANDSDLGKMFLGSLNLTLQGCVANFEFVVVTNNSKMIQTYSNEFEFLWKEFEEK